MTNADLAAYLNTAVRLTAGDAVTPNVIRQWVAWDVLPKAAVAGRVSGHGPIWERSEFAMRRALRLAELRSLQVKRRNAVIVQAYIEWGHNDLECVRAALLCECEKWRSQITRQRTSRIDDSYENLSSSRKRALKNQFGPLDHRLADFTQPDELYALFMQFAETGEGNVSRAANMLLNQFAWMAPGFDLSFLRPTMDGILAAIRGLMGSPDEIENSAEQEVCQASEREFRTARFQMRRMMYLTLHAEFPEECIEFAPQARAMSDCLRSLSNQIAVGPWAVFQLIAVLMWVRRRRTKRGFTIADGSKRARVSESIC